MKGQQSESRRVRMEEAFDLLKKRGPMTTPELAELMGLNRNSVAYYIDVLYDEFRIHIAEWREIRAKGCPTRIWAVGHAEDAPRPAKGGAIVTKKPSQTEKWEQIWEEREARMMAQKAAQIRPFKDPMIWALFGGVAA